MGFFSSGTAKIQKASKGEPSLKLLHQLECRLCPLNHAQQLRSPKMLPTGSEEALLYFIGEAPGKIEDEEDEQFVERAPSGNLLRNKIPRELRSRIRYNNTIRCHPPNNRDPEKIEIECCRPSIERDIEAVRPKAIVGFGLVPLHWVIGWNSKMWLWRGRRIPVQIGSHKCWYFPMAHPSGLLRNRKKVKDRFGRVIREDKSDGELAWERDLENIFATFDHLPPADPHSAADADASVQIASGRKSGDLDLVLQFLHRAAQSKLSGLDLETKRTRPYLDDSKILTVAISLGWDDTLAFAWDHPQAGWTPAQRLEIKQAYLDYLRSRSRKAVHNLAFEQEWHAYEFGWGLLREGLWECTMSQASILDERFTKKASPGPLSLEWLVFERFGFNLKKLTNHLDKNNLDKEPIAEVLRYNGMDAKYHRGLCIVQEDLLDEQQQLPSYDVKLRQIPTCVLTQLQGVPVDPQATKDLGAKYADRVEKIEAEIFDLNVIREFKRKKGKDFKPGSAPDVEFLLSDILGTNIGRKENGKYSTEADVLLEIGHPACKLVVDWRHNTKIKSTYIDPYSRTYPDGLLHCQFNTVFTHTGRLSSEDPNMQNQIKRDKEAKEIRSQVATRQGEIITAFDYGQIEFRILAMASRDPVITRMIWEGYDVHGEWAQRIAKRCPEWVKEPMHEFLAGTHKNASDDEKKVFKRYRDLAKNEFVFPLCFGAGLYKIANELGVEEDKIKPERDEFWRIFTGVGDWHDDTLAFYEKYGFVETLTGHHRRRYPLTFNELINEPIQGTAAEIVMNAMNRLSEREDPIYQPMLNIHDDLTFRHPENRVDDIAEVIIEEMLDVGFPFVNVPISVEMSIGKTWDKMSDVGTYTSDKWLNWPERLAA